jgi:hypothetical protein
MLLRRKKSATAQVIHLPKVAPRDEAHAQWSHTLPQDFAETVPTAISFTAEELPRAEEPPSDE